MFTIPKFSNPLTKLIRTLEGLLVMGSNVALVVAPILTSHVTPAESIKYGVLLNGVTVVSRSVLKAVASLKFVEPATPALSAKHEGELESAAKGVAGQLASDLKGTSAENVVEQVVTDAEELASPPPGVVTLVPDTPAPVAPVPAA